MWIFQNGRWQYFEADKGTGTGEAATPPANEGTGDATGNNGGDVKPFKTFGSQAEYQADLDAKLKERIERERNKAKADLEKSEAEKLRSQQQFEQLAQKETTRADTLQTQVDDLTAKLAAAEEALNGVVTKQIADVPQHFRELLDGLPTAQKLAWITTNGDKLKTPQMGVPATPKAAGDGGEQSFVDQYIARQNARK